MNWDHFYSERRNGFDIDVFVAPEHIDPSDLFDEGHEETIEAIRDGRLEWFVVKVEASRHGVTLGVGHLGACCYASVRDFLDDDYYDDMVAEATWDAHETLARLREEAA